LERGKDWGRKRARKEKWRERKGRGGERKRRKVKPLPNKNSGFYTALIAYRLHLIFIL